MPSINYWVYEQYKALGLLDDGQITAAPYAFFFFGLITFSCCATLFAYYLESEIEWEGRLTIAEWYHCFLMLLLLASPVITLFTTMFFACIALALVIFLFIFLPSGCYIGGLALCRIIAQRKKMIISLGTEIGLVGGAIIGWAELDYTLTLRNMVIGGVLGLLTGRVLFVLSIFATHNDALNYLDQYLKEIFDTESPDNQQTA